MQQQHAMIPIGVLVSKKISFQNKFSNRADVFQSPNFINTRALCAMLRNISKIKAE